MPWRKTVLLALLAVMALGLGKKSKIIYQAADSNNYVRVIEVRKGLGPFAHPATLSPALLEPVLLQIQYLRRGLFAFGKNAGKPTQAFPPGDAANLAQYLSQALAQAEPEQWVDFSWKAALRRSQGSLFVNFVIHDGVAFIEDGKLNLAFRNLGYEQVLDSDMRNQQDPIRGYVGANDLALPPNAEWPAKVLDAKGQPTRKNWIAFPLTALSEAKPPLPGPPAPQPLAGAAAPVAVPAAPGPAPALSAPVRSPEDRLQELKTLLDRGLITPKDYEQKKQEILKEL